MSFKTFEFFLYFFRMLLEAACKDVVPYICERTSFGKFSSPLVFEENVYVPASFVLARAFRAHKDRSQYVESTSLLSLSHGTLFRRLSTRPNCGKRGTSELQQQSLVNRRNTSGLVYVWTVGAGLETFKGTLDLP